MLKIPRSFNVLVEEQINKWRSVTAERDGEVKVYHPVITISREPGTGGTVIAKRLAEALGMDIMSNQIIHKVAESVQMSEKVVSSLDEKDVKKRDNWLTSLFESRHLWPDNYLRHLMKVISTIGRHGNAVILGRGANYILPLEETFRVRLVAPKEARIARVMASRGSSRKEAEEYITQTGSNRDAFIRKYFHTNIADPAHYDLVIDSSRLGIDGTIETIKAAFNLMNFQRRILKEP
ncbi:MAG: cytidylate kinase-like family protein [Deltaproteobacteria bacterium]|nr:cytidylate kinase-like family protein [Deltaproteobacteria bacterium]